MSIKNNNHIVKDFFSAEELNSLKFPIYEYYKNTKKVEVDLEEIKTLGYPEDVIMVQPWSGRAAFNATALLPKDVVKVLEDYVLKHDNNINSLSCMFVRYANEFGTPSLGPHLDDHDTNFTIDYQLESNLDWDINVDGDSYYLQDNSAMVFSPSEQVHWRTPKLFEPEQYLDMLLFYFETDAESIKRTSEEKRQIEETYREAYIDEYVTNMKGRP